MECIRLQKNNVLFVCLGNICRSPMAEAMFKKLVQERGIANNYNITSAATSSEESGNQPHPGARKIMDKHQLNYQGHRSHLITKKDIETADYIITMDKSNLADLKQIIPVKEQNKLHLCMDIVPGQAGKSIVDPWYTHRFEDTYQMLHESLPLWLDQMQQHNQEVR
ncbi:protein tyrosine phosphatase [Fructilactobacillus lindneri]|nr:low molecular weight protein-tyrosine-phosphatase [Fructilactobacillus lindneri]ANZ57335.1 protein tyrosine phosphatase [Fructilactobacillus lindneri]ANZ58600.1 protein tyrosine phosphatase [Fructilactobacillus lindneri]POG97638.1 protein tyrosine phosphatase [Fructilactobacillus lindneri]POG98975.1 protein tyrosine phosphatase [Fructilactobacillus lindneri]POG99296.1 protein tyrosine phosphatase [Fructilactobacillus lindneri]